MEQPQRQEEQGGGEQLEQAQQAQQPQQQEDEAAKAERLWQQYLERDDSPISDLFGGQLQVSRAVGAVCVQAAMQRPAPAVGQGAAGRLPGAAGCARRVPACLPACIRCIRQNVTKRCVHLHLLPPPTRRAR